MADQCEFAADCLATLGEAAAPFACLTNPVSSLKECVPYMSIGGSDFTHCQDNTPCEAITYEGFSYECHPEVEVCVNVCVAVDCLDDANKDHECCATVSCDEIDCENELNKDNLCCILDDPCIAVNCDAEENAANECCIEGDECADINCDAQENAEHHCCGEPHPCADVNCDAEENADHECCLGNECADINCDTEQNADHECCFEGDECAEVNCDAQENDDHHCCGEFSPHPCADINCDTEENADHECCFSEGESDYYDGYYSPYGPDEDEHCADVECDAGKSCALGECFAQCDSESDCGDDEICFSELCMKTCDGDDDCGDLLVCHDFSEQSSDPYYYGGFYSAYYTGDDEFYGPDGDNFDFGPDGPDGDNFYYPYYDDASVDYNYDYGDYNYYGDAQALCIPKAYYSDYESDKEAAETETTGTASTTKIEDPCDGCKGDDICAVFSDDIDVPDKIKDKAVCLEQNSNCECRPEVIEAAGDEELTCFTAYVADDHDIEESACLTEEQQAKAKEAAEALGLVEVDGASVSSLALASAATCLSLYTL